MKPFQIVWELIEFGIQALFLYILAIIIFIGIMVLVIKDNQQPEPVVVYKDRIVKEYIPTKLTSADSETINQECTKPAGCRVLEDGTVEY